MNQVGPDPSGRRADVVARVAAAYRELAALAETIDDEWQYITDLTETYLPALEALVGPEPGASLSTDLVEALDEACAEIALIRDAHRAIDWLSTFPHVVALALGGDVDAPGIGESGMPGEDETPSAPDDDLEDSPFRRLLERSDER